MLLKLSGKEIEDNWEAIKTALVMSALPLADKSPEKIQNILTSLLDGRSICWAAFSGSLITTVVITTMIVEELSQTKNLLVYCAHGFRKHSGKEYFRMAEIIGDYAVDSGCIGVMLYSSNDRLTDLLVKHGARADYRFVVFPLLQKST